MQLNYVSKLASLGFAYAPLKSPKTAPVCDLCPATVNASRAAGDMPLYAAGGALLEPLTRRGMCTAWDATSACCQPRSGGRDGGDTPLIAAVIASSRAALPSIRRVYIVGVANGGFMALRVACEIGEQLSGVVAYAAGMYASQCAHPERAPSMILVQGEADVVVPYAGGKNSVGVSFPGHAESVGIWRQMLGCDEESRTELQFTAPPDKGVVEAFPNAPLTVHIDEWSRCSPRAGAARRLEGWRIANGQHFANHGQSVTIFQRALAEMLSNSS